MRFAVIHIQKPEEFNLHGNQGRFTSILSDLAQLNGSNMPALTILEMIITALSSRMYHNPIIFFSYQQRAFFVLLQNCVRMYYGNDVSTTSTSYFMLIK